VTDIDSNGESYFWGRLSNRGCWQAAGRSSSSRIPGKPPPPLRCLSREAGGGGDGESLRSCK